MYIEVHQAITGHPKTTRLTRALNVSRAEAVGIVVLLNLWAMDYAPDGDLTRYDADELADACQYDGQPDDLVAALVKTGWLDRDGRNLVIHDWDHYGGKVVKKYTKERVRAAARRAAAEKAKDLQTDDRPDGRPADVHGTSDISPAEEESRVEESTEEKGAAQPSPGCGVKELGSREELAALGWLEPLTELLGDPGKAYAKRNFGLAFATYRERICKEAAGLSAGLGDPPDGCEARCKVCKLAVRHMLEGLAYVRAADPSLQPAQLLNQMLKRNELLDEDDITSLRYLEKQQTCGPRRAGGFQMMPAATVADG